MQLAITRINVADDGFTPIASYPQPYQQQTHYPAHRTHGDSQTTD